jgi:hypothetical protein
MRVVVVVGLCVTPGEDKKILDLFLFLLDRRVVVVVCYYTVCCVLAVSLTSLIVLRDCILL